MELKRKMNINPSFNFLLISICNSNYETNWNYPGINVTAYEDQEKLRYIGYTNLTFLDIEKPSNVRFLLFINMHVFLQEIYN